MPMKKTGAPFNDVLQRATQATMASLLIALSASSGQAAEQASSSELCKQGLSALESGETESAEKLFLQSIRLGEHYGGFCTYPTAYFHIAELYEKQGKKAKAEFFLQKHLAQCRREFPDGVKGNRVSISVLSEIATFYLERLETRTLATTVSLPRLGISRSTKWSLANDQGDLRKADRLLSEAVVTFKDKTVFFKESGEYLVFAQDLARMADLYYERGELAKAILFARHAVYVSEHFEYAEFHKLVLADHLNLLASYLLRGQQFSECSRVLERALAIKKSDYKPRVTNLWHFEDDDWEIAEILNTKHSLLFAQGKTAEAEKLGRSLYQVWPKQSFVDVRKWSALAKAASHGCPYADGEQQDDVLEQLLVESKKFGPGDIRYSECYARLAVLCAGSGPFRMFRRKQNDFSSDYRQKLLKSLIKEAVNSRERVLGSNSHLTANFLELLARKLKHSRYDSSTYEFLVDSLREKARKIRTNLKSKPRESV
jgi:tetratricopeptide (TPR) repeat protein